MVIVDDATAPRARRLVAAIGVSALAHGLFALLVFFDVMGIGSGLGLGVGPGFGVGSGGGAGLGEGRRREVFSLQDVPEPGPPADPAAAKAPKEAPPPPPPPAGRRPPRG